MFVIEDINRIKAFVSVRSAGTKSMKLEKSSRATNLCDWVNRDAENISIVWKTNIANISILYKYVKVVKLLDIKFRHIILVFPNT